MLDTKIGMVGAGRIGAGLATLTAGHGCPTIVIGASSAGLERCRAAIAQNWDELIASGLASERNKSAALARIWLTLDYEALTDCEFVLEAAVEQLDAKRAIYEKVERICGDDVPIASTTSAISADVLASCLARPARFLVAHPFQPAHMQPLIELVGCAHTDAAVLTRAKALFEALDREVIVLRKSVPGFVINRFAQALFREALYLIEQGVTSAEDVDKAIKYAVGMRYASIGLLEYFDDVGFPLEREIAETVYPDLCGTREIQQTVLDGIQSGHTGRDAGQGLYDWSQKDDADYLRRKAAPFLADFHWDMPED